MSSAGDDDMALPLCARTWVECTPTYSPHCIRFFRVVQTLHKGVKFEMTVTSILGMKTMQRAASCRGMWKSLDKRQTPHPLG